MLRVAAIAAIALGLHTSLAKPKAHIVGQKDKRFSQAELVIAPGDSVIFVNDDKVIHNVFSSSEPFRFNLKTQAPGRSAAVPFPTRGVAQVRCAFHPGMKLTIRVE